ncbi:MAG: hypothetical protein AAFQ98_18845, partial [Bacteroidota bacterium]
ATLLDDDEDGALIIETVQDTWIRNLGEMACANYQGLDQVVINIPYPMPQTLDYYNIPIKFYHSMWIENSGLPGEGDFTVDLRSVEIWEEDEDTWLRYRFLEDPEAKLEFSIPTENYRTLTSVLTKAKARFFRDLVAIVPEEKTREAIDQMAQLPSCSCEQLTVAERMKYLRWISEEIVYPDHEAQVNRLLSYTPQPDREALITQLLAEPQIIRNLYDGINGAQNRDEFVGLLSTYRLASGLTTMKNEGQAVMNLTRGGAFDKVQDQLKFTTDGSSQLRFLKASPYTERYWVNNVPMTRVKYRDEEVFRVDPLDPVYVRLPGAESPVVLTALAVKRFADSEQRQESIQFAKASLDLTLLFVGVAEVSVGLRALRAAVATRAFSRELISLSLGSLDLAATTLSGVCDYGDPAVVESDLCNEWGKIGPYVEAGLLTTSMIDLFYTSLRTQAGRVINDPNVPNGAKQDLEDLFPGIVPTSYTWFDADAFRNATIKTPGVDNNSVTNLPKSFWNDAYKATPTQGSAIKETVDDIIANGDRLGTKTEGLVNEIMQANGYQSIDGKYFGENGVNGFDGVFYKGTLEDPSEIIIIESKQMNRNGSASLSPANQRTQLPSQMSNGWITFVANKLDRGNNTDVADLILLNSGITQKYVSAIDKVNGTINFLKLGEF